uniref:Rhodanese domain-containing protein n=1 Tax=Globodera pallida TaxID=36090 RepID=A0A183BXC1_GLOPA
MPLFWRKQEKVELPKRLTPLALKQAIAADPDGIRLLDCAFVPQPRPANYKYGRFDPDPNSESLKVFCNGHIEGAVHFDLALATCPTDSGQFDHYPKAIFERYAQMLGLDGNHQLVLYGRGLFWAFYASRVYWLFISYGHKGGISLLDGGLDEWVGKCRPLTKDLNAQEAASARSKKGNWRAMTEPSAKTVTFQQLVGGANAVDISRCKLLDARTQTEFEGNECAFEPLLTASHRAGAVNLCAMNFINAEGQFKSSAEIRALVQNSGLVIPADGKKLITFGNTGIQAAFLATMLDIEYGVQDVYLYIGSAYKGRNQQVGGGGFEVESRHRLAETFHDFKQTPMWVHLVQFAAAVAVANNDPRGMNFIREMEEYVADRNPYHSVDVVGRRPVLPEIPLQPPSNGARSSGTGYAGNTLSSGGWQDDEIFH